eukprot:TRINITY_DN11321_c0_g3_i1.p1 TRINITY_DN11321_c0_g3~~TRINITY_DN11321_c0_g3_i1.p1  ORF type:complete len:240 (+),score=36.01 TRINITY_DN11321_c0_g3_i1:183-902(+)
MDRSGIRAENASLPANRTSRHSSMTTTILAPALPIFTHLAPFDVRDGWRIRFTKHDLFEQDTTERDRQEKVLPALADEIITELLEKLLRKPCKAAIQARNEVAMTHLAQAFETEVVHLSLLLVVKDVIYKRSKDEAVAQIADNMLSALVDEIAFNISRDALELHQHTVLMESVLSDLLKEVAAEAWTEAQPRDPFTILEATFEHEAEYPTDDMLPIPIRAQPKYQFGRRVWHDHSIITQ